MLELQDSVNICYYWIIAVIGITVAIVWTAGQTFDCFPDLAKTIFMVNVVFGFNPISNPASRYTSGHSSLVKSAILGRRHGKW